MCLKKKIESFSVQLSQFFSSLLTFFSVHFSTSLHFSSSLQYFTPAPVQFISSLPYFISSSSHKLHLFTSLLHITSSVIQIFRFLLHSLFHFRPLDFSSVSQFSISALQFSSS